MIATSTANGLLAVAGGALLINLFLSLAVADYGHSRGYPFLPLALASFLIPFGVPIVLLAVVIGAGPRR